MVKPNGYYKVKLRHPDNLLGGSHLHGAYSVT